MPTDVMCMTMILLTKLPRYATRRRTISLIAIHSLTPEKANKRRKVTRMPDFARLGCKSGFWLSLASKLRTDNFPRYDDFDAAIFLATIRGVVVRHRILHSQALSG